MSNDLMTTKIAGAGLATALGLFALAQAADFVVPGISAHGGGHGEGEHGEQSLNELYAANYAYYVPVAEGGSSGGPVVEEVFDLGAALASADLSKGERAFKGNCKTCHTIEQGGANGTGPNLFGTVGAPKAGHEGFGYSGALQAAGGNWTYEDFGDCFCRCFGSAIYSFGHHSFSGVCIGVHALKRSVFNNAFAFMCAFWCSGRYRIRKSWRIRRQARQIRNDFGALLVFSQTDK